MKDDLAVKNYERAYNYAVYLLSLKLRTEGELREKMKLKKYNPEIIDEVIKKLYEYKYLDDQRYAEVYLENLKKYKNFGYYGIKKKLMEKRLPSSTIEKVLADGLAVDEETKIAQRLIIKLGTEKTTQEQKEKLAQKLRARGFRNDVIAKAIF
jgi:regulatory protein